MTPDELIAKIEAGNREPVCPGCYADKLVSALSDLEANEAEICMLFVKGFYHGIPLQGLCREHLVRRGSAELEHYDGVIDCLAGLVRKQFDENDAARLSEGDPDRGPVRFCIKCQVLHEESDGPGEGSPDA